MSVEKHRFYFRKSWFDRSTSNFNDCVQTTTMTPSNGSSSYVVPIQLTLDPYTVAHIDEHFIEKIRSSSIKTAFTHLQIDYEQTYDLHIDIISLLANLRSLEIRGIKHLEDILLPSKIAQVLPEVWMNNKIARVKLHQMNDIQLVYFLLDLCPQMEYLEVGCTTEDDVITMLLHLLQRTVSDTSGIFDAYVFPFRTSMNN